MFFFLTYDMLSLTHFPSHIACTGVHGDIDRRQFNGRQLTVAGLSVEQFFVELYHSAAEMLPEMPDCELADVDWSIDKDELAQVQSTESKSKGTAPPTQAKMIPDWDPGTALLEHQMLLGSHENLPMKHIQHSKPIDLWWLYLAWVSLRCPAGTKTACWSTFWQKWHCHWRYCLGLRKPTQHAQCTVCAQHSQYIHCSDATPQDKHHRAKDWQQHLREQYHDRLIYWHLRWLSLKTI